MGGKNVARVSKTPGRTQAINFFDLHRGSFPCALLMSLAMASRRCPSRSRRGGTEWSASTSDRVSLALVVVLVDMRRDPTSLDREMVDWLADTGRRGLLVLTKSDRIRRQSA